MPKSYIAQLDRDDPGIDAVVSRDATAIHRLAALNAAEAELRNPKLTQSLRDEAAILAGCWRRSLDRRLEALANGSKPSDKIIDDPYLDPSLTFAAARAAREVTRPRRVMAFEDSYCL